MPAGAKPVLRSASGAAVLYTVPANGILHVIAAWISAAGTITASKLVYDPNTRTILGTVGTLDGIDVQVPEGETVNLSGGTGGIVGWLEAAP